MARPLSTIAAEIREDWNKQGRGVSPYAKPYLDAMATLDKITDRYFADDAESIVLYFLSNATSWKGETARNIKKELKALAGIK